MIGKHARIGLFAIVLAGGAWGQVTRRVSVSSSGAEGNDDSGTQPPTTIFTPDGRFVVFPSQATNFVTITSAVWHLFVRDLQIGTTEIVDVSSTGIQSNGDSIRSGITPDGRYVVFDSHATNIDPGDINFQWDVYLRDRQLGTTTLVSVDSNGIQGNDNSYDPEISADGRFVAFVSEASNLVPGDTNGSYDIFVRDLQTGSVELVSVDSTGSKGNSDSTACSMSSDGRFVAFVSVANDLVPGDTNNRDDIFVRDRLLGTTERIDLDSSGNEGLGAHSAVPAISADGRFVAFHTAKTNLVPGDTNGTLDVFVRDRQLGTTERVSVATGGGQANGASQNACISGDGRYVAFHSSSNTLITGDTNALADVFVHDLQTGTTELASITFFGGQGNSFAWNPSITSDGRYVSFVTLASNFVPGDTNATADVFVRDRVGGTDFTIACEPGAGGVAACPCSNAPSGSGRGCDNSSGTGGATISATGATSLSSDYLVFTTSGERPTALSVVFQGTTSIPAGIVYGQGVRCAGGALKRLYAKNASGGGITAPVFGAGELPVSVRSAQKGDVIPPGGIRYYFVAYRDPVVLGGCPATRTFNVTTTGEVSWSP